MPYAPRRKPFQPNAFGSGMLSVVARRASDGQIARAVAKRRVNMLQRSGLTVNRRAAIVATGAVGKDGGYIGSYQFGTAIAPIGKVGPIAMPRHDNFTTIAPVVGALVAQMLVGHKSYSTKTPVPITSCRPMLLLWMRGNPSRARPPDKRAVYSRPPAANRIWRSGPVIYQHAFDSRVSPMVCGAQYTRLCFTKAPSLSLPVCFRNGDRSNNDSWRVAFIDMCDFDSM